MEVSVSVNVNAPREKTFQIFNEYEHIEERIGGLKAVTINTDMPPGPGFSWTETRELYGREASETMTIEDWDAPKSLTVVAESHGTKYKSFFDYEETETGTRVTMRFTGTPQTFMAKIMGFFMGSMMRKSIVGLLEKDLQDLKQYIEGGE